MKTIKQLGLILFLLSSSAAQAHLVSFGWTDNGNGTVRLWGEHWHGDQTTAYSDNGGITITDTSDNSSFLAQWAGVQNNTDRDDMLTSGALTGWSLAGNGTSEYRDWFYTDDLVIGNGTWDFFTGGDCCVDTMNSHVLVTLTGITSVDSGTGPGSVNPVPIPAAVWLFGSGLLGLIGFGKKSKA